MAIELIAAKRELEGTGASRRLRRAGQTPAVVYGAGKEAVSITLDHNTIYHALKNEAFHKETIELVIDGQKELVKIADFQLHPYKQLVLHLDFARA